MFPYHLFIAFLFQMETKQRPREPECRGRGSRSVPGPTGWPRAGRPGSLGAPSIPAAAGTGGQGWRDRPRAPLAPARGVPALTISMILVFRPVFLFKVNMYWASTTPATRAHKLALATAPTRAMAARSMDGIARDSPAEKSWSLGRWDPDKREPGKQPGRPAAPPTFPALREPRPRGKAPPPPRAQKGGDRGKVGGRGLRRRPRRKAGLGQSLNPGAVKDRKGHCINSLSANEEQAVSSSSPLQWKPDSNHGIQIQPSNFHRPQPVL